MSTFKVSKQNIITACDNILLHVEQDRNNARERFIEDNMTGKFLFFRFSRTREQATRMLATDWSELGRLKLAHNAIELKAACEVASEEYVCLDTEDAAAVSKWLHWSR